MAEVILIIATIVIAGALLIHLIQRVTKYYYERFRLNLWIGVMVICLSFVLLIIAGNTVDEKIQYTVVTLATLLLMFTIVQDIRLSSFIMGIMAFLLQIAFSIIFVAIVISILLRIVTNRLLGKRIRIEPGLGIPIGTKFLGDMRCFFSLSQHL